MKNFDLLGKFIQEKRVNAAISQESLALALGYKNGQYISNCERGKSGLPEKHIVKISEIIKCDPLELINVFIENYKHNIILSLNDGMKEDYGNRQK